MTNIEWLHAEERTAALPREPTAIDPDQSEPSPSFGELAPGDRWFVSRNAAVSPGADTFITSILVDSIAL